MADLDHSFKHVFPALRGVQAGREYYVTMCPLRLVPKLFQFNEEEVPASIRAQRVLNQARIPGLTDYLATNTKSYVFSSLTASIDGQVSFDAAGDRAAVCNTGTLSVPMDARIIINDGQHRRAAIEEALKLKPEIGDEHVSVVFFLDRGLKRSQQMFADLNKHAVRPTKSIGILFDHRDQLSRLACRLADEVEGFAGLIELEKTTISNRSIKLFTLSSLYQATAALLRKGKAESISPAEAKLAIAFWSSLANHMSDWQLAAARKISSAELRRDYVHAHGVALHAIGVAASQLVAEHPSAWRAKLKAFDSIDWRRANTRVWEGRALQNGRVSKAHQSLLLTAAYLKRKIGVTLTPEEKVAEQRLRITKR